MLRSHRLSAGVGQASIKRGCYIDTSGEYGVEVSYVGVSPSTISLIHPLTHYLGRLRENLANIGFGSPAWELRQFDLRIARIPICYSSQLMGFGLNRLMGIHTRLQ